MVSVLVLHHLLIPLDQASGVVFPYMFPPRDMASILMVHHQLIWKDNALVLVFHSL